MKLIAETENYGLPDIPILVQAGDQIGTGIIEAIDRKMQQYYIVAGIIIIYLIIKK